MINQNLHDYQHYFTANFEISLGLYYITSNVRTKQNSFSREIINYYFIINYVDKNSRIRRDLYF